MRIAREMRNSVLRGEREQFFIKFGQLHACVCVSLKLTTYWFILVVPSTCGTISDLEKKRFALQDKYNERFVLLNL